VITQPHSSKDKPHTHTHSTFEREINFISCARLLAAQNPKLKVNQKENNTIILVLINPPMLIRRTLTLFSLKVDTHFLIDYDDDDGDDDKRMIMV
jgi:hypothetical protein